MRGEFFFDITVFLLEGVFSGSFQVFGLLHFRSFFMLRSWIVRWIREFTMDKERILVLEDDQATRTMLGRVLEGLGFAGGGVSSGEHALELLEAGNRYAVYIVDLNLPGMGGRVFIQKLKSLDHDAVILVATGDARSREIIDTMKQGVFDYVMKPLDMAVFETTLKEAVAHRHRIQAEQEFIQASSEKLRERLEWLSYKESRSRMGDDSGGRAAIYNLKTSLSQGGGFGALLTLIDMLKFKENRSDDGISRVESSVLDLLYENAETARRSVEGLEKLEGLMNRQVILSPVECSVIIEELNHLFLDLEPYTGEKELSISLPAFRRHCRLEINLDLFRIAIRELVVNAVKFSRKGGEIGIFSGMTDGYFVMGVKNDVEDIPTGGIPEGQERLVLEPFYRVHPPVESFRNIEQFSLGLGLTTVDMIMGKHHGLFFIENAMDHTSNKPGKCVIARMLYPLPDAE